MKNTLEKATVEFLKNWVRKKDALSRPASGNDIQDPFIRNMALAINCDNLWQFQSNEEALNAIKAFQDDQKWLPAKFFMVEVVQRTFDTGFKSVALAVCPIWEVADDGEIPRCIFDYEFGHGYCFRDLYIEIDGEEIEYSWCDSSLSFYCEGNANLPKIEKKLKQMVKEAGFIYSLGLFERIRELDKKFPKDRYGRRP